MVFVTELKQQNLKLYTLVPGGASPSRPRSGFTAIIEKLDDKTTLIKATILRRRWQENNITHTERREIRIQTAPLPLG
jgi:hypothetical protein